MAKDIRQDIQKLTDETIAEGGVLALLYFDVHGASAEEVRNKMVEFVSRINMEPGVVTCYGEIKEPIQSEGMYSTAAEVKVLTKDFNTLLTLGMRYGPISAEILRPEVLKIKMSEAATMITNVASTSHQLSTFILNKVLSKEELERFQKVMKQREEIGRKLLEEKK
ncbi:MAG: hypothetical protein QXG98_04940 [Candidatus Micrarchaeia archaeon]